MRWLPAFDIGLPPDESAARAALAQAGQVWLDQATAALLDVPKGTTPTRTFYRLEADGSFVKTIGQYQLAGTYDFEDLEGKTYVTLNFDEASIQLHEEKYLIHYCGQHHEYFNVLDSKTVVGSWGQCDGPNFYFRRK